MVPAAHAIARTDAHTDAHTAVHIRLTHKRMSA